MNQTAIFWPMLAHILLVFIIYGVLAVKRTQAVKQAGARARDYKARNNEPEHSQNAANNLLNQFEAPVVFHVLCLSLYATGGADAFMVVIAWIYVLTRYVHAWIHVTTNKLLLRTAVFWPPLLLLVLMAVWLALHLLAVV
jgi:hypothetical protein